MPGYAATPLVPVPALARRWGIASVHVKDESHRLGLPAFKILGASWAANRGLCARAGRPPAASLADLRDIAGGSGVTLVTATDGNHGRAGLVMRTVPAEGNSTAALRRHRPSGRTRRGSELPSWCAPCGARGLERDPSSRR
jgi:hypothetical protein